MFMLCSGVMFMLCSGVMMYVFRGDDVCVQG